MCTRSVIVNNAEPYYLTFQAIQIYAFSLFKGELKIGDTAPLNYVLSTLNLSKNIGDAY